MGRVIRKLLFILSALVCIVITLYNINNIVFDSSGTGYIVNEYVDTYYEPISDNVGLTTINGISNVYINMEKMGYKIYKEDISNQYIDVSFVKDGNPSYRYSYQHNEGKITFFCSEYENSYTGVSYINEEIE